MLNTSQVIFYKLIRMKAFMTSQNRTFCSYHWSINGWSISLHHDSHKLLQRHKRFPLEVYVWNGNKKLPKTSKKLRILNNLCPFRFLPTWPSLDPLCIFIILSVWRFSWHQSGSYRRQESRHWSQLHEWRATVCTEADNMYMYMYMTVLGHNNYGTQK